MTVTALWVPDHTFTVSGVGYAPEGQINDLEHYQELRAQVEMAVRVGVLCNEAELVRKDDSWHIQGDPTEGALLVVAAKIGMHRHQELDRFPRIATLPFKSERQYMATAHRTNDGSLLCVKGAVERLLPLCTETYPNHPLDPEAVHRVATTLSNQGLRLLALAVKSSPMMRKDLRSEDIEAGGLSLVGVVGILDPPRPEAAEAVARAQEAGIRVIMVTGDHALTAQAIARQLGIGGANPRVMTGREMEGLDDTALTKRVQETSVFARTTPHQKHRLVTALRAQEAVVAVTGDGVNDAPALRAADIGIAMGKSGTDVAKEAADMVLVDDHFATIVSAVEEGRAVFESIRKVVLFLAVSGVGLLLAVLIEMLYGHQLIFSPSQILWMNLATTGLTDVALATEPGEAGLLRQPPRPRQAPILTQRMWQQILVVAFFQAMVVVSIFRYLLGTGASLAYAQTMAVTTRVFSMLFFVLEARSLQRSLVQIPLLLNRFLFVAVLVSILAQLAFVFTSPLQTVFRSTELTLGDVGLAAILGASVLVVVEIEKGVRRWHRKRVPASSIHT